MKKSKGQLHSGGLLKLRQRWVTTVLAAIGAIAVAVLAVAPIPKLLLSVKDAALCTTM